MGIFKEKRVLTPKRKIIACLSQKGGGGKSTLSRVLSTESNNSLLIDLDWQQKTSWEWSERRKKKGIKPLVNCQTFPYFDEKILETNCDYLIIDCPARISEGSLKLAQVANLIIQPVRPSLDDLNPAVREFNGLTKAGISKDKLAFVLNAVSSNAEEKATRNYLEKAGYFVFSTFLSEKISYREAQNQGLSIGEVKYPRLKERAKELVKEILSFPKTNIPR